MKQRQPAFEINDDLIIVENRYGKLTLALPPQPSYFFCKTTKRLFGMIAGGDCTASEKKEDVSETENWQIETLDNGDLLLKRSESSAVWKKKTFCLRVTSNAFCWYHELEGEGKLEDVRFFRSCYQGREYGFAGNFDEVYTAAPNFREQQWFHPCSRVVISNGNDSSPNTGLHALASVPHVMGLHDRRDKTLMGVAAFAEPGEYLWDEMIWNPEVLISPSDYHGDLVRAGGFALSYYGKKQINGNWTSPELVFTFPDKVENTLGTALEYAYTEKLLPRPKKHKITAWWQEPIYCMWDDQTALAFKSEIDYHRVPDGNPGEFASEYWADRWLDKLAENNIKPGIIILDDKWQKTKVAADPDTEKWKDLRGWIDRCHEKGIRVFLWGLAWHNEDIPLDEAITRDGEIVAGDVTNPAYEKRLREKVYRYFSSDPGCLNADGVKIDGLMALPVGRGLKNYGNIWGLELQKRFLQTVYSEAKKVKPEVCISTFTANPYLDEFSDMVRLADMFTYRLTTEDSMRWRYSVFKTTNPYVLIDTDSQLNYNLDPDYLHALDVGAEMGIPTIYNAEFLRRNRYFFAADYRTLTREEYRKTAEIFAKHRKKIKIS